MDIYSQIPTSDPALRKAIYKAHNGKCFYTGRKLTKSTMVIDHILPKAKGGQDCIANYVPTCKDVNSKKGGKVDLLLVERMCYLNKIAFASKVLKLYLSICNKAKGKLNLIRDGEARLKPYIKENFPFLINYYSSIRRIVKNTLEYREVGNNIIFFRQSDLFKFFDTIDISSLQENDTTIFTLRLPDDLNTLLTNSAQKAQRSKSAHIIWILRSFLLAEQNRRNIQDDVWLAMRESSLGED